MDLIDLYNPKLEAIEQFRRSSSEFIVVGKQLSEEEQIIPVQGGVCYQNWHKGQDVFVRSRVGEGLNRITEEETGEQGEMGELEEEGNYNDEKDIMGDNKEEDREQDHNDKKEQEGDRRGNVETPTGSNHYNNRTFEQGLIMSSTHLTPPPYHPPRHHPQHPSIHPSIHPPPFTRILPFIHLQQTNQLIQVSQQPHPHNGRESKNQLGNRRMNPNRRQEKVNEQLKVRNVFDRGQEDGDDDDGEQQDGDCSVVDFEGGVGGYDRRIRSLDQ